MRTHRATTGTCLRSLAALLCFWAASGCEVTNPGPVGDEFISLPASQAGLVNGSWERINLVTTYGAYHLALAPREMFPGGQTGNYGRSVSQQAGNLGGWDASGVSYNAAQQARWIAEEAIRQFTARGDVPAEMMTRAYLAAGYANRLNGDHYCWGVIDSGPLIPGSDYWKRAEEHFTKALAIAASSDQQSAAYAGRAHVRLALEDWPGALADAKKVPNDFVLWLPVDFSSGGVGDQRNHVYYANGGSSFRSFTFEFTFYHDYYLQTGDPRTPWREFPNPTDRNCVAALQGFGGSVPCTQQMKYTSQDDDIELASGGEMRLIEAEAMLRANPGGWPAAMTIINANRQRYLSDFTKEPLEPWVANNLDDAWTFLMRERGIELWLEARRFADLRRWERYIRAYGTYAADGQTVLELPKTTPGTLDWPCFECAMLNKEVNIFTTNQRGRPAREDQSLPRELCFNISDTERENNPNILDQGSGGGTP
jgi:hypothetical protein